ncbi:MAG TPA: hypothetical protein VGC93_00825, partial [Thermoanaerobaculia bacterium]
MERTTNSAFRLHRLLLALRGACRDGRPIRDALGEVFELDPADDLALRRKLVLLDDLFVQSQAAIAAIPGLDPPRYLRYFPAARKGLLSARLDQDSRRYAPFQEGLSDIVLQSVEFCGLRIAEEHPELVLPPDDLAELEARLNALFAYTARTELDPPLRAVALDILQALRAAVADYRIHGARGLQESVERAVGKLTVHYLRAKKQGAPLNLDYLDRLLDLIIKAEALLAKAHVYLPALTEYLPK